MKLAEVKESQYEQNIPSFKRKVRELLVDLTKIGEGKFEELPPRKGEILRYKFVGKDGVMIIILPEVNVAISNILTQGSKVKIEMSGNKDFLVNLYHALKNYKVEIDVSKLAPGGHNIFSVTLP